MATRHLHHVDCPGKAILQICRHYRAELNPDLPRITVPHNIVKNMQKMMTKKAIEKAQQNRKPVFKSPLIISCKRPEFNHHLGQTYSSFNPKHLASYGWKHRKSHGDHFTILPYEPNPSWLSVSQRFEDLGVSSAVADGLKSIGISQPTRIQEITVPKILKGHCVMSAAETGSGKTLAYLTPLIELIHRHGQVTDRSTPSWKNSPQAIIVVPTRELADQIMGVAQSLSEVIPFKVQSYCGGRGTKAKLNWPEIRGMDILISTPGVLRKLLSRNIIRRGSLRHLVLDEMDTLMDDSFSGEIIDIIKKLQVTAGESSGNNVYVSTSTQVILVGATVPRGLSEILNDVFPVEAFHKATTDHVHRLMPHVSQKFIRLRPSSKPENILRLSKQSILKSIPTLIFCNKTTTCSWLTRFLDASDVDNMFMSGFLTEKSRAGRFESFQNGEHNILVCTDIASRGLDTLRVERVINYECPDFMSDYIHRSGRAGRVGAGSPGHVVSFVSHPWEVDLINKIEVAARRMTDLHNVNANIKRKLVSSYEAKHGMGPDE
ncbi:probable ATP-dependent RNA helicase DDX28 [Liolophura sinensis]|uniref:probable ATP-dependent RNA helicase DDX28 n=1 Tax=Liolophura sinensis TaxID=3198878 RepID=UPI0031585811